jgi:hypothetical protein
MRAALSFEDQGLMLIASEFLLSVDRACSRFHQVQRFFSPIIDLIEVGICGRTYWKYMHSKLFMNQGDAQPVLAWFDKSQD